MVPPPPHINLNLPLLSVLGFMLLVPANRFSDLSLLTCGGGGGGGGGKCVIKDQYIQDDWGNLALVVKLPHAY